MKQSTYFQVNLSNYSVADFEVLSFIAFEFQVLGIQEHSDSALCFFDYNPIEFVESLSRKFKHISIHCVENENKDWLQEWKKGLGVMEFVPNVYVVPTWCIDEPLPLKSQKIIIDPGSAFGTGIHETTQLAAKMLDAVFLILAETDRANLNFLDIGTGSGILAILAHLKGVSRIVAIDTDDEALKVCRNNFEVNGLSQSNALVSNTWDSSYEVEILVANIISSILTELSPKFSQSVKEGGYLVVSGILKEESQRMIELFIESGFSLLKVSEKGIWVGMIFIRRRNS